MVGKIERIGASNTISSVGDGVELMQVYYTKYLPSLLYCFFAASLFIFSVKRYFAASSDNTTDYFIKFTVSK